MVVRSLYSVLGLFLLEGLLIRVCSLLTSMQVLGLKPMIGVGSTRWPNCDPPCGVAQGGLLIQVIGREVGVVGGGVEQKEENGSGTSRSGR